MAKTYLNGWPKSYTRDMCPVTGITNHTKESVNVVASALER